jgi:hypothetical protein
MIIYSDGAIWEVPDDTILYVGPDDLILYPLEEREE